MDKAVRRWHTTCSPTEVSELVWVWRGCASRPAEPGPAITAEMTENTCWLDTFEQCAMLVRDCGEIVGEAPRRGWGLFYPVE